MRRTLLASALMLLMPLAASAQQRPLVTEDPETIGAGPKLRFQDNYLQAGRRPLFMFGTDDWAYVFNTKRETPLQWLFDMRLRRDFGVEIYENLQFGALPPFTCVFSVIGKVT